MSKFGFLEFSDQIFKFLGDKIHLHFGLKVKIWFYKAEICLNFDYLGFFRSIFFSFKAKSVSKFVFFFALPIEIF